MKKKKTALLAGLLGAGVLTASAQFYRKVQEDRKKAQALQEVRDTATQWLLLMQIGTDEKAGMGWGDDGQLYLWIRRDDLRAQRFDQARLVLQCY